MKTRKITALIITLTFAMLALFIFNVSAIEPHPMPMLPVLPSADCGDDCGNCGYAKPVPPIGILTPEETAEFLAAQNEALANADILLNGGTLANAPKAFMDADGILMVPVRAVAEALGLRVEWFADTRTVQVGIALSFTLDSDAYAFARMTPVSLGTAPVLKNSSTYVPINLFAMLTNSDYIVWYLEDDRLIIDIPIE
jgi:hypothetical protein